MESHKNVVKYDKLTIYRVFSYFVAIFVFVSFNGDLTPSKDVFSQL